MPDYHLYDNFIKRQINDVVKMYVDEDDREAAYNKKTRGDK